MDKETFDKRMKEAKQRQAEDWMLPIGEEIIIFGRPQFEQSALIGGG